TDHMINYHTTSQVMSRYHLFFFFQAEDGIRGFHVTGVQTCALPICHVAAQQDHHHTSHGNNMAAADFSDLYQAHVLGKCDEGKQIGRASCRERGYISTIEVLLKKK